MTRFETASHGDSSFVGQNWDLNKCETTEELVLERYYKTD